MEAPAVPPPDDRAACRVCLEPIRRGASKCTKCDSFQDWRRVFSINTVVLTLIVALISVISATVPVLKEALTPHRSDVRISILEIGPDAITVVVSNLGNRAAILKRTSLRVQHAGTETNFALQWNRTSLAPAIQPGTLQLISFYPQSSDANVPPPTGGTDCRYQLSLDVIAFDHRALTVTTSSPCPHTKP
jgi:hypothetical protein